MIKIIFNEEDISALRHWRFQHPDPRVQVRMEALYLRSQGVAKTEILRLCGLSKASFHRYLKAYMVGGITQLKHLDHYRPHSELTNHRTTLEAYFHQHPPATVAEAAAKLAELPGMVRKPTQVRQYLRALGMKPMKVGRLPAKADVDAQDAFKKKPGTQVTGRWGWPARRLFH
jgi:transposase